jgi:hypothetical protein
MLIISVFSYMIPIVGMRNQVNLLSYYARIQGGITPENIETFKGNIYAKYSYINKNNLEDEINIEIFTEPSNIDLLLVDISEESDEYVRKEDGEIIVINVQIPSNKFLFSGIFRYFGILEFGNYSFSQVVSSERN